MLLIFYFYFLFVKKKKMEEQIFSLLTLVITEIESRKDLLNLLIENCENFINSFNSINKDVLSLNSIKSTNLFSFFNKKKKSENEFEITFNEILNNLNNNLLQVPNFLEDLTNCIKNFQNEIKILKESYFSSILTYYEEALQISKNFLNNNKKFNEKYDQYKNKSQNLNLDFQKSQSNINNEKLKNLSIITEETSKLYQELINFQFDINPKIEDIFIQFINIDQLLFFKLPEIYQSFLINFEENFKKSSIEIININEEINLNIEKILENLINSFNLKNISNKIDLFEHEKLSIDKTLREYQLELLKPFLFFREAIVKEDYKSLKLNELNLNRKDELLIDLSRKNEIWATNLRNKEYGIVNKDVIELKPLRHIAQIIDPTPHIEIDTNDYVLILSIENDTALISTIQNITLFIEISKLKIIE